MISLLKALFNPSGAVIVGLVFLAGLTAGVRVMLWKVGADEAAATSAAMRTQQGYVRHADKVATKVAEGMARIEYRTRTIIKEVPIYVSTQADNACTINRGFVELFNSSAQGRLPKPALDSDEPAAGIALSFVGRTSAENHDAYWKCREYLDGWQEWCRGVNCLGN